MGKKISQNSRLMFISPWLLAAAVGLLLIIILVFAANTLQRGKLLLTDSVFHKGLDIARFVGAGIRASVMMGVPGSTQVQHLIEQAVEEDQKLLYVAVLDSEFRILAHNDKDRVGKIMGNHDYLKTEYKHIPTWHIAEEPETGREIFEVIAPFQPFKGGRGGFMRNRLQEQMSPDTSAGNALDDKGAIQNDWCRVFANSNESCNQAGSHTILIGLSMQEFESFNRQNLLHILIMSAALLFIGLGAWIALLAAQGYRTSQNTIQHMQAFTNLLISRLPVGIMATGRNGRVQTYNQAAAAMTGAPAGTVINGSPDQVLPREFAAFFDTGSENNEVIDREIVCEQGNRGAASFHVSSVPVMDEENMPSGRVVLIHDLTRLKLLEKEVRRHEQLAALGKMAAGVAHEVRNPLSSIKGFATLLGSRFQEGSKERETATLLINEVERLNRSITELLNYARPTPLNRHEFDAAEAIGNSLKLIEGDAQELGVSLRYEIAQDCPKIYADQDRLNQVLLNLYLNSLQAMTDHGGTLSVSVQKGETPGTVAITVQDNGSGIPANMLRHILEPYVTTRPGGTGLGLAMVHKIIDDHSGLLAIESEENKGTTVTLSLPGKSYE